MTCEEEIELFHGNSPLVGERPWVEGRSGPYRQQSPVRAYPQQTGFLRNDGSAIAETVGANAPDVNSPIPMAAQLAIGCVKPYRTTWVFTGRHQTSFATATPDVQTLHAAIFHQKHTGCLRSDPEIAVAILKEKDNSATIQTRGIALVEDCKSNAIETHQAIQCS